MYSSDYPKLTKEEFVKHFFIQNAEALTKLEIGQTSVLNRALESWELIKEKKLDR